MPRRVRRAAAVASAVCSVSMAASAQPAKTLRPSDLVESPQQFLSHTVDVEIVERLNGIAGDARAQLCVALPEAFSCALSLVAPAFKADDPDRYKLRFEAPLRPPVRVRGEFLRDDGLTQQVHLPGYVIRVSSAEPLPEETPIRVASVAELVAQRELWDRRRIVIEGTWVRGFEISTLDREIWVHAAEDAEWVGMPKLQAFGPRQPGRVRITGVLFARPGRRYGHMASASMSLLASKVEYLGRGTLAPAPRN